MKIEGYSEAHKEVWDDFVKKSKNGTFLFLRDYMEYHRDRFEDHSLLIWEGDRLISLVPANQRDRVLFSHQGITHGGFVTDESMKTPLMLEMFDETLTYLKESGFERMLYKTVPYIHHRLPADEDRYALFLCHARLVRRGVLAVVTNEMRLPFQKRRSRGAAKAVRQGLDVRLSEDFEIYWPLLTQTICDTYGVMPVHNLAEISLLHSRFPDNIKLYGCYKDTELLAGVVIYESEQVARCQYIAASTAGKEQAALDLTFDVLLNEVYRDKPFIDFGTSDENDGYYLNRGLIEQKEGFGARVVAHDHYEIDLSEWQAGQLKRVMG